MAVVFRFGLAAGGVVAVFAVFAALVVSVGRRVLMRPDGGLPGDFRLFLGVRVQDCDGEVLAEAVEFLENDDSSEEEEGPSASHGETRHESDIEVLPEGGEDSGEDEADEGAKRGPDHPNPDTGEGDGKGQGRIEGFCGAEVAGNEVEHVSFILNGWLVKMGPLYKDISGVLFGCFKKDPEGS